MGYLILSILFSTSLLVFFKFFEKYNINNTQAIVVNYFTATTTGFLFHGHMPESNVLASTWFPLAFLIGSIFICLFIILAYSSQKSGITITTIANKMSMIIPAVAAVFLYQDQITLLKIVGILLAIVGVILSFMRTGTSTSGSVLIWVFPVLIFIGSGVSDTLLKYAEEYYLQNVSAQLFTAVLFSCSAIAGFVYLLILFATGRQKPELKSILGGILLGVPNYFSIHFLFLALQYSQLESSVLYPVNNMGIVVASALTGLLFFREKFSFLNWIGLVLSLFAIAIISFS